MKTRFLFLIGKVQRNKSAKDLYPDFWKGERDISAWEIEIEHNGLSPVKLDKVARDAGLTEAWYNGRAAHNSTFILLPESKFSMEDADGNINCSAGYLEVSLV